MKSLLMAAVVVTAAASTAPAQTARPTYNYGYTYNPIQILNSEYLQKDLKLTKEQLARIHQINLQMEGAKALLREDFAKEVGLSEDQIKKFRGVYDDFYKQRDEIYKMFRTDRKAASKKYAEWYKGYKTIDDKALEVLTKQQKSRLEKMLGEPFDRMQLYPRPMAPKKKPNV